MGLLSDLNPVKRVREGFESITGISDARTGINRANAAQQAAVQKAIEGLEAGGLQATQTLQGGQAGAQQALQGALGLSTGALGTGLQQSLASLQQGGTGALQALGAGRGAAVEALKGQTGQAISTLDPIAGLFDPNALAQNFSVGGFGNQLASFADPQGAFSGLFNQRQQSARNTLAAAGLSRSGRAAEEAANIDLETALGLSSTLFDRQIQNPAFEAIQNQALFQSGLGEQLADVQGQFGLNQADILSSLGLNQAFLQTGFGQDISGLQTGFGGDVSGLQTGLASDLANLQLGQATNIANLGIGGAASQAQALQALGGLRGQVVNPLIEAAIGAGTTAFTGGFG